MNHPRQKSLTLADAESMLRAIPSDDREVWLRMAMALKSEYGDQGFPIWDQWSRTADNYDERAAKDVWKSIKDGPVSIGTLIHLARSYGFRDAQEAPVTTSTQAYAQSLWLAADFHDEAVGSHPYAIAKGIHWAAGAGRVQASGSVIGRDADCIVVPIRTNCTGKVQAVQAINPEGKKQTFGPIRGGCLVLGNTLDKSMPWYVAEGWASAVSVVFHHRKGNAVCGVAFGKSNMDATAEMMNLIFDPTEIVILEEQ